MTNLDMTYLINLLFALNFTISAVAYFYDSNLILMLIAFCCTII